MRFLRDERIQPLRREHRVQAGEPARRHRGRALDAPGAGQHHFGRAAALREIMGREADAPLMRRQAELGAHGLAHPRIGIGLGRPAAFVEAAQDHHIGALQAGFERPPNEEPRMATIARPNHAAFEEGIEQSGIFAAVEAGRMRRMFGKLGHELGRRLAVLAGPKPLGAELSVARGEPFGEFDMAAHEGRQFRRPLGQRREGCRRFGDGGEPVRRLILSFRPQRAFDAIQAGLGPGAAQHRALHRAHHAAEKFRRDAARREGMLERGEKRSGRGALGGEPGGEAEKDSGRGLGERRTGGIVDLDAPALELRRDAARQAAIRRHQRRRRALLRQAGAEAERDGAGLDARCGAFQQGEIFQRLGIDRRHIAPGADRLRRMHRLGDEGSAGRRAGRGMRRRPGLGIVPRRAEAGEQLL